MKQQSSTFVAVYGTLRKGECNHRLLTDADPVGAGRMPDTVLYGHGMGFPYVTDDPTRPDGVVVEVYAIDGATLFHLDRLEGYRPTRPESSHYLRVERPVTLNDGTTITVETYLVNRTGRLRPDAIVETGDWFDALTPYEQHRTRPTTVGA